MQVKNLNKSILLVVLLLVCCTLAVGSPSETNCTSIETCSGRGQCLPQAKPGQACLCDDGYITFDAANNQECNYKQTQRLPAFLVEFFFGIVSGAGCFMLGENGWGSAQIVLFWVGLCVAVAAQKSETAAGACFYLLWSLALLAVEIAALVLIGSAEFTDKNGALLGDWV